MILETLRVGALACNCSIVGDPSSGEAIVVDPGADIVRILERLTAVSLKVRQILITHAHIDHIAGALTLQEYTGAPILYNQADLPLVAMMEVQAGWLGVATPVVPEPDSSLEHGDVVAAGSIRGNILHTPGHTKGSLCIHFPEDRILLAGDTLFAGSVGRTDLPGGNHRQLLRSVHNHLLPLPDDTRVIPGHGEETTIGQERATNPFLLHL